ncbi:hypothetical protein D3C77_276240 [compost metagenome]
MFRNCRPLSPEEVLAMRTPSTRTRLCAVLVPRMKMFGTLPRPPVRATCTPGTRVSRSVTLVGCRRSMSSRVNTVLAALDCVRSSTWRLALIRVSGSFRALSRSMGSARRVVGRHSNSGVRRESFMGCPIAYRWQSQLPQCSVNFVGAGFASDEALSGPGDQRPSSCRR